MAALTRDDIVAALSGIEGLHPAAFRPTALSPGHAWPAMTGWKRIQGRIFGQGWGVYVVLASDDRAAAAQWDLLMPSIVAALENIMTVDEVLPVSLAENTPALFAAVVVARSQ